MHLALAVAAFAAIEKAVEGREGRALLNCKVQQFVYEHDDLWADVDVIRQALNQGGLSDEAIDVLCRGILQLFAARELERNAFRNDRLENNR